MGTLDDAGVLRPFTEAALVALREMAGLSPAVTGPARPIAADVSAAVRLVSDRGGPDRWLVLSAPAGTAADLARRVLGGDGVPDPGLVRDCLGELANVVAGQAKAALFGTPGHFTLTPPETSDGPFPGRAGQRWAAGIASEAGEFVLEVRRPDREGV